MIKILFPNQAKIAHFFTIRIFFSRFFYTIQKPKKEKLLVEILLNFIFGV